jgi:hypothetical protein
MRMNVFMIAQRVLMPASSAASGLPPIANTDLPKRRRVAMKLMTTVTTRTATRGHGMPDSIRRPPSGIGMPWASAYLLARGAGQR